MKYLRNLIFFIILVVPESLSAQYYNTGQDPSRIKWQQINTGHFKVIYPEAYGTMGADFARSLEKAEGSLAYLYPVKKFRIPVIIHNYTTQSNGYVAWAPKRMEIYPTPEQNTIPLATNEQLALHELTHVLQMESLNTGFSKAMSYLAGQQFIGAVASLLPLWFMEGDAVFSETVLSGSGRGRSPDFIKELKALVIERGGIYKYDKMLNGSWKNYTPDHYRYGYQMVTWSFVKNDLQLWNKTMKLTGNQPFTLNPVNISLRKNAGLTKKRLFEQTFDSLGIIWKKELEQNKAVKYEALNPPKKGKFTSYYSPVIAGADSVIAIKTSLTRPASIVLLRISDLSERRLHIPGSLSPRFISFAKDNLVWVETRPDPRWDNRNYSVIMLKNIRTGITQKISSRSRYMSASISPDGKTIAASENTVKNSNNLVLLNASDGEILRTIAAPENASLQRPQWSADGSRITVIYLTDAGEGIMSFSPAENSWKVMITPGRNDLQSSFLRNDSLFYISSYSGTNDIYVLSAGNRISQVTRSRFSSNDLNIRGSSVIFTDYTSDGNDICMTSLNDLNSGALNVPKSESYLVNRVKIEKNGNDNLTTKEYTPLPYRKWQHLFSFHSWMPIYADIEAIADDPASIRPGVTVYSQNQLSTLISTFGYEYSKDHQNIMHAGISWKGWYPVIESKLDYSFQPWIKKMGQTVASPSPAYNGFRWNNSIYFPFNFSSGMFTQNFYPTISADYMNQYIYITEKNAYDPGQVEMSLRLYFSNYGRSAYRDIYPQWAQVFDLRYSDYPLDRDIFGPSISLKTAFYFPGILRNNGIRLRYETKKQDYIKFIPSNIINFPRSYTNIMSAGLNFMSFDYVAPLVYPDFNISSLFYLTRIRAGLFYDFASGTDNFHLGVPDGNIPYTEVNGTETFRSFGAQLLSDFYLFRIPYTITAGVQAAWKSVGEAPALEAVFNIDIYGMNIGKNRR